MSTTGIKVGTLKVTSSAWGKKSTYEHSGAVDHAWKDDHTTVCGKSGSIQMHAPANIDPAYWVTCKACRKAMGW